MGRFWSLLFLTVPILGVLTFVCAIGNIWPLNGGTLAFPADQWLPDDVSENGGVIDNLFMFILYLTGVIFIGTSIALFLFMWKFDAEKNAEPVKFTHGSHTLEIVWSILPAAALLFIAIYQMNAWVDAKMKRPTEMIGRSEVPKRPLVEVTGRQFEWRLRYAGADGQIGTPDDLHAVNDLHIPVNQEVVITLKSQDVLHSFFLPNLRVKQDAVPGMKQFVWFQANEVGAFDIVCAELCGWGHYKMRGRLTVESQEDFDKWFAEQMSEQERTEFTPSSGDDDE
ncbi:MAG: cytochrome c oxidase subunit II [Planctomycetaceae bacterium]|nr:cytochrome c oxidase subunit II [Planctomycetaceae bacterium]